MGGIWRVILDWVEMLKLRLASLVVLGAFVGALLGMNEVHGFLSAVEAAFWIACSAAAGCALNQVIEQEIDSRMERTRNRPLLTGRISVRDAVLVSAVLGAAATFGLALRFNLLASFMSLASLFTYVAVYTPLKKVSALNTLVGAFPGAAPIAIGYVAMTGEVGTWAISLFLIVFAWQFPHFMAIAWIHREDYRQAGLAMVPVLPGGEKAAGVQALGHSVILIPVSLLPALWGDVGVIYAVGTLTISLIYAFYSGRFAVIQDQSRAKALFCVSLGYLPALFALILVDRLAGSAPLL
ncbi:MAG: protoheme IX farnesyltransferase [Planctomycetota bacterium]